MSSPAWPQSDQPGVSVRDEVPLSSDRVARLCKELEAGTRILAEDEKWGLLPALLEALSIPEDSQCLVFSKTSFQPLKIAIDRPRAIYFNDDCYVGWVQESRLIEIGAASPELGAAFYTLDADRHEMPIILRDRGQCLVCHDNHRTQAVPGFLVRSVYVSPTERFVRDSPAFVTDHSSPLSMRWGGWYVTGSDGEMTHLGNKTYQSNSNFEKEFQSPDTRVKLPDSVASGHYIRTTSDIVALMVLEHQTQMHNHISKVGDDAKRLKLAEISLESERSARPAELSMLSERLDQDCRELTRYLLMIDEFNISSPVTGDSGFTKRFSKRGPHDNAGRSLYQLDLHSRLFRFPCSYLIYSDVFESLPTEAKKAIGRSLGSVLLSRTPVAGYETLSDSDRKNIIGILRDTKKAFWESYVEPNRP